MTEIEKVLEYAKSQVGYTCKDKKNKYALDIDAHQNTWDWYNGRKAGFDWCTIFFDYCFIAALGVERARTVLNRPKHSLGAAVRYSREYLLAKGRVSKTPQVGCAVYFGNLPYPHHIGLVYKVTKDMIYTYEGNCTYSGGLTGVKARSYKRTYSDILDYGMPLYSEEPIPPKPKEDEMKFGELKELWYRKGNVFKGDAVEVVQSVVNCDVDGSFGPKTQTAVKNFQKKNGLNVDGLVGAQTWEAIFNQLK